MQYRKRFAQYRIMWSDARRTGRWIALGALVVAVILAVSACGGGGDGSDGTSDGGSSADSGKTSFNIGVTSFGQGLPITEFIQENVQAKYGITIKTTVINDEVQANEAVNSGELDGDIAQNTGILGQQRAARHIGLTAAAPIYSPLIGIYSKTAESADELPEGATVAIPNDPADIAHSLDALSQWGLIKLDPKVSPTLATTSDIVSNPKNIELKEVEGPTLTRVFDDVDAAVVLVFFWDSSDQPESYLRASYSSGASRFATILALRDEDVDKPEYKKLIAAYEDPAVLQFIAKTFKGASTPVPPEVAKKFWPTTGEQYAEEEEAG